MIIKVLGHENNKQIKIEKVTFDYLKELSSFFYDNNSLSNLYNLINSLVIRLTNVDQSCLNIINQITNYVEGENSSAIENINISNLSSSNNEDNFNKISSYINEVNKINLNSGLVNTSIIESFHNAIEPTKTPNIRKNITQYIGNYKAPDGSDIVDALNNYWDIYYGNNQYQEIDTLIRWAYQHLYFELIHPFDDGNGRTGRMLNLFFFKNQKHDLFDNFLIETSSTIFIHKDAYIQLLAKAPITIRNQIYSSDLKQSLTKDIAFVNYMFTILTQKLNTVIYLLPIMNQVINGLIKLLNEDSFLKKYTSNLINFFSSHIIFTRKDLMTYLAIAEATTSKIMQALVNLGLINDYELVSNIKNERKKIFIIFNELTKATSLNINKLNEILHLNIKTN